MVDRENLREGFNLLFRRLKEDMKILHAMKIRILRTYNVQLAQAETILEAIHELKK